MFGSTPASGHDNSGVSGQQQLIPTRFVWPYGGSSVFISGSFTRWTEHLPMSPTEGLPTVFQIICSVTPGYHQYKFFVDGQWRHDELQAFVNGNYGVVNTVFVARQPMFPATLTVETPGRTNMDVDDAFPRGEAIPRISETDLEVSRHRISLFLSKNTAYELLPELGKVIALDVNLPVKQAFHILYEQGIPVAPLWDFSKGQFVGVLSVLDFILILRELGNHGSNLTEEELETHTISAWKDGKMHLKRQIDVSYTRRLFHEAIPRISETDLEVSRHRISLFLSKNTAYELLPESGKVIALDVNLPVKQAFHILYEQGIPVAPLWDFSKGQFVGVLSVLDFILILRELCT